MTYQITSENIEVSQSMIELSKNKLAKIEGWTRDLSDDAKVFRVIINSAPLDMFIVKIDATINGKAYISEASSVNLEHALILATEELEKQYQRRKEKQDDKDWELNRDLKRFPQDDIVSEE